MPAVADRVRETTTTAGTGTVTLAGAQSGFRTFASAFAVGTPNVAYALVNGAAWEVGLGTLASSTTLTRDIILASSASGAAISLSGGSTDVFNTAPSDYLQGGGRGRSVAMAAGMDMR